MFQITRTRKSGPFTHTRYCSKSDAGSPVADGNSDNACHDSSAADCNSRGFSHDDSSAADCNSRGFSHDNPSAADPRGAGHDTGSARPDPRSVACCDSNPLILGAGSHSARDPGPRQAQRMASVEASPSVLSFPATVASSHASKWNATGGDRARIAALHRRAWDQGAMARLHPVSCNPGQQLSSPDHLRTPDHESHSGHCPHFFEDPFIPCPRVHFPGKALATALGSSVTVQRQKNGLTMPG